MIADLCSCVMCSMLYCVLVALIKTLALAVIPMYGPAHSGRVLQSDLFFGKEIWMCSFEDALNAPLYMISTALDVGLC